MALSVAGATTGRWSPRPPILLRQVAQQAVRPGLVEKGDLRERERARALWRVCGMTKRTYSSPRGMLCEGLRFLAHAA